MRGTGVSAYRRWVTIPKLPPPPRRPHRSSGSCWSSTVDDVAVDRHHLGPDESVARESLRGQDPADAAGQRQAADASVDEGARRSGKRVSGSRRVEIHQPGSGERLRRACDRIDDGTAPAREVDEKRAVRRGMAGHAVAASADADGEVDLHGPPDGRHDVGHVCRAEDVGRLAGGQRVVRGAGCLVPRIMRLQHLPPRARSQITHGVHSDLRSSGDLARRMTGHAGGRPRLSKLTSAKSEPRPDGSLCSERAAVTSARLRDAASRWRALTRAATAEPERGLRRVHAACSSVQVRKVLAGGRLADAELVRRGRY